jgi:hypothetical protein
MKIETLCRSFTYNQFSGEARIFRVGDEFENNGYNPRNSVARLQDFFPWLRACIIPCFISAFEKKELQRVKCLFREKNLKI